MNERFEEEAQQLYQQSFASLSPFGQALVRQRVGARVAPPETVSVGDLIQALDMAHAKIARLEQDNKDLWDDNEDLRTQLSEEVE
jgi:hypothetical protein